jgi:hypothetical protein
LHLTTNTELVDNADVIVRARAVEYETPPAHTTIRAVGVADSIVRFQVVEVIRGDAPSKVTLHGYLTQSDDFNDQKAPYTFVRPGGRGGMCFANTYRQGAEYLLFLKRSGATHDLTVNWAALAPVNEELHDGEDPWVVWVRDRAKELQR